MRMLILNGMRAMNSNLDAVRSAEMVGPSGPTTPEGKARSSRNALKHGLRASSIVLPSESTDEWDEHREGIHRALSAANALESELVDRIAELTWRQRRVVRAETARHKRCAGLYDDKELVSSESIQRYETHLARQLAVAIATLERARTLVVPALEG